MTNSDLLRHRLANQYLTQPTFQKPEDVVAALGAVQAQDYAGAKWALAQRMNPDTGVTDAVIERAFTEGKILRTHLMRPTWHFVTPADIRWLLELTAPRVNAVNAFMNRKLELDDSVFKRSAAALTKALQGGKQLTRAELGAALEQKDIPVKDGMRLGYIVHRAELDGLVCSGARRGKQFTYALLNERVPPAKKLKREEALVELTRRYFSTRGPATLQDFIWWSGLTMKDAKQGMNALDGEFEQEVFENQTYWFPRGGRPTVRPRRVSAHLLPNYDEYFIGYKNRDAFSIKEKAFKLEINDTVFNAHVIELNGQLIGGWKRELQRNVVALKLTLLKNLTQTETRALTAAAERFGKFLGLSVVLT